MTPSHPIPPLPQILLECLKDAPGGINDDNDGKGNPKDSSFMRRVFCLPGGKKVRKVENKCTGTICIPSQHFSLGRNDLICSPLSYLQIMATPREIELAAKYIIDRFGFAVEAEEANPAKGEEVKGKMEDAAKVSSKEIGL